MAGHLGSDSAGSWTLVLPVQHAERAKTRLQAGSGVGRADLARAIASDTLAAVLSCAQVSRVVLVTSDPVVASRGRTLGAQVVPDPGAGLGAAIDAGLDHARAGGAGALAVLLADLPALRPDDLGQALTAASAHRLALVPDLEGTGSVLLASSLGGPLPHAFGADSAARHAAAGAAVLDLDLPRLRRDVDMLAALDQAEALGLGPATRSVLEAGRGERAAG